MVSGYSCCAIAVQLALELLLRLVGGWATGWASGFAGHDAGGMPAHDAAFESNRCRMV